VLLAKGEHAAAVLQQCILMCYSEFDRTIYPPIFCVLHHAHLFLFVCLSDSKSFDSTPHIPILHHTHVFMFVCFGRCSSPRVPTVLSYTTVNYIALLYPPISHLIFLLTCSCVVCFGRSSLLKVNTPPPCCSTEFSCCSTEFSCFILNYIELLYPTIVHLKLLFRGGVAVGVCV